MQIRVNANHTIKTGESLDRWASFQLNEVLERFKADITTIEVHLSDENSDKISEDHKRCMLEARLPNLPPVAVNHHAPTLDDAFRGACDKLKRALDHTVSKQRDHRSRESIRRDADLGSVDDLKT